MGLLNLGMLAGLAAASIPVIIHLLNRRRHRVVDWAAMRFLKMSFVTRHRRLRIEELILLLLRTLLIVVLVLALARPFVASRLFSSTRGRKDLVILLDSSFSMALKDQGSSLFDRAREQAARIIDTLSPGDSLSVILASRVPVSLLGEPSYDLDKVKKALVHARVSLTSLDVPKSLGRAFALLEKGQNPVREILVITDGQSHGWFASDANRWKYVTGQLAELKLKPAIYVLTVPRTTQVANLGLGAMTLRRTVVGTDRDVHVSVSVTNTGEVAAGPGRLTFSVDGERPEPTAVERLLPGTSATVSFSHRFTAPGSHYVQARLVGIESDMLAPDDRAYLGVEVLETLPVLLVDGSAAPDPTKGATLFLASALRPVSGCVVSPTVVAPSALAGTDLRLYRTVVLANVGRLGPDDVARLEDFVRLGGGLLVAPGESMNIEDYNATLWRNGAGLLPAELRTTEGDATRRDVTLGINLSGLTHETTTLLADPEKSDLGRAQIHRYVKMSPPTDTPAGSGVVLRLANGDPLVVEKDFGRGRVMMCACPLDASWSNLPLRSSFVVLAHEFIYYLSSPLVGVRNLSAGEPLVVTLDEKSSADEVQVVLPMGGVCKLPVERRRGRLSATCPNTAEAGLYEASYGVGGRTVREYYVVNCEPAESSLTPLSASSRETLAGLADIRFFPDWNALEGALLAGHGTREFWEWLAALTVSLLVAEVVLTRGFTKRRTAPDGIGTRHSNGS
jgi:hypothetical protein